MLLRVGGRELNVRVNEYEFGNFVKLLKDAGGRFDPNSKVWSLDGLTPELYRLLYSRTGETWLKDYVYGAFPSGNYFVVSSEYAGLVDYSATTYKRRRWDPDAGEYVEEEVKLHITKEDGSVLVPRGLALRALQNIRFKPFKPNFSVKLSASGYRQYQVEVLNSVIEDLRLQGASTIMMATGGGKSYMLAGFVKDALDSGAIRKAYYIAMSLDLVNQFAEFAEKWGLKVSVLSGEEKDWSKPVVAATIQTLYKAFKEIGVIKTSEKVEIDEESKPYMDEVELSKEEAAKIYEDYRQSDMVIADEVQHLPSTMYKSVVKVNPWSFRVSASATPFRNDGKDLEIYAFGGLITRRRVTSSELIRGGFLVPAFIIMWKRETECYSNGKEECRECIVDCMRSGWGDFEECADECKESGSCPSGAQLFAEVKRCVFNDDGRNRDIIEITKMLPKPTLLLTREVAPAKKLHRMAIAAGLRAELAIGAVKGSRREEIFDLVRSERVDVLVADTIADEGLDLPSIRSLLITGGGKSKTRVLQRVGRVVRPWKGKKFAIVVDIWDTAEYFYEHGMERVELYKMEPEWKIMTVGGPVKNVLVLIDSLRSRMGEG